MPKQIILYNLRDDVKDEDYIKWCHSFKGPLLLGLGATKSFTLLKMSGGRKGDGQKGVPPAETKSPYQFVGILDITSPDDWMKDVGSKTYQDFLKEWFTKWVADFYAIMGGEVYQGESK
ncbi:MAG: hypothetical protein KKE57_04345 [Proteobacteria bacterium]|nr:hypothetical protein [Pseudomonadota bacterium]